MLDGTVSYTAMADGTREDYELMHALAEADPVPVADNVLALLRGMTGHNHGSQVDRYVHSLQTATRAHRDGADEEMVCVALLHDIGDLIAPKNHSQFAAAVLRPYISEENYWLVRHHGIFQGYYYFHHFDMDRDAREKFRGHPGFEPTADFCEKWDQVSFDPNYDTMPLDAFEPMVHRLFAKPNELYV